MPCARKRLVWYAFKPLTRSECHTAAPQLFSASPRPGGTLRLPRFLRVVCALTWLSAGSPAAAQTGVDAYIRETMRESGIPGLSIAVVKGGKVVKASGSGIANLETNTPATPDKA